MREQNVRDIREEFLGEAFGWLVENGLDNMSLRELCKGTGLSMGSVYYWFDGKDELLTEAAEYGMRQTTMAIFEEFFGCVGNIEEFFDTCIERMDKYRKNLRFIYQMAASPIYGEKLRRNVYEINHSYDEYIDELAEILDCNAKELEPLVYIFMSAVLDNIIWDDRENSKMQVEYLKNAILGLRK